MRDELTSEQARRVLHSDDEDVVERRAGLPPGVSTT
jgi:hypothetical protein